MVVNLYFACTLKSVMWRAPVVFSGRMVVQRVLEPGEEGGERGTVADVCLPHALKLGRVLAGLGHGDGRRALHYTLRTQQKRHTRKV